MPRKVNATSFTDRRIAIDNVTHRSFNDSFGVKLLNPTGGLLASGREDLLNLFLAFLADDLRSFQNFVFTYQPLL